MVSGSVALNVTLCDLADAQPMSPRGAGQMSRVRGPAPGAKGRWAQPLDGTQLCWHQGGDTRTDRQGLQWDRRAGGVCVGMSAAKGVSLSLGSARHTPTCAQRQAPLTHTVFSGRASYGPKGLTPTCSEPCPAAGGDRKMGTGFVAGHFTTGQSMMVLN